MTFHPCLLQIDKTSSARFCDFTRATAGRDLLPNLPIIVSLIAPNDRHPLDQKPEGFWDLVNTVVSFKTIFLWPKNSSVSNCA